MTNMTGMENLTSIGKLVVAVDNASGNWASILILISLFIVVFVGLLRSNAPAESILASSTVTALASWLLLGGGFIDVVWVVGFTLIWGISAIALYLNR